MHARALIGCCVPCVCHDISAHYTCQLQAMKCIREVQQRQDQEARGSVCLARNPANTNDDPDLATFLPVDASCVVGSRLQCCPACVLFVRVYS